MKCMTTTMLGETAYRLKDIQNNENIKLSTLRRDIKNGVLIPSGKSYGAYYVIQSELDKYLKVFKKQIEVSEKQIDEMKHALGLNYSKKPYRNRFYCQGDDENWNDLVNKGLANKSSENEEKHCCFWLTKLGVAFMLGRSIDIEKYKDL